MQKPSTFLLLLFSLFIWLTIVSDVLAQPPLIYQEEGVDDVKLELESISVCPWNRLRDGDCSNSPSIQIYVYSKTAEKEGLSYYYNVSGGKIVGKGSRVIWDFSNTKIGKHSITVGVGKDSIIKGKTITKEITLRPCDICDPPCECAVVSVLGPTSVTKVGGNMAFTAQVSGGTQNNVTYNWTVSEGEIIEGQGTKNILVKTTPKMKGHTVTATVEIGGLCNANCPNTFSASAEVNDK